MKWALQSVKPILDSENICKRSQSTIFSLGDSRKNCKQIQLYPEGGLTKVFYCQG
jgi:hypothetical protein